MSKFFRFLIGLVTPMTGAIAIYQFAKDENVSWGDLKSWFTELVQAPQPKIKITLNSENRRQIIG